MVRRTFSYNDEAAVNLDLNIAAPVDMATALPTFDKFVVFSSSTEHTVGQRWKKWLKRFEVLLTAMNITDGARKQALLLHYAGEEVFDIFESFSAAQKGEDEGNADDSYAKVKTSLSTYFEPKKNVEFEVFKFRQMKQEPGETVDNFCTRLRLLAATCDFTNTDRELKSQILQGCTSTRLRRRGLRDEMELENLLKTARSLEISDVQATEMEADEAVNAVYRNKHPQQGGRRSNTQSQQQPLQENRGQTSWSHQHGGTTSSRPCAWCGGHCRSRTSCPARDKQCRSCSKMGHFAKVCRSKPQGRSNASHDARMINTRADSPSQHSSDSERSESEYAYGVSSVTSKTPKVNLQMYGESVPFFIDTGASVNILDDDVFRKINAPALKIKPTSTNIFAYGSSQPLKVRGTFETTVSYKKTRVTTTFFVVQSTPHARCGNLLSAKTAQELELLHYTFATSTSAPPQTVADHLVEKTPQLFEGMGKLKDVKVKFYVDESVQPTAQPHRRIPFHLRKKVEAELKRLEQLDVIEKVDGPTPWVSPIVVAPKPKKPEEIRICVDMRLPNQAIKRTRHIMPTIDDILSKLNQATVFSKLDLNSGYHQLELDEESRNITTFSTHVGLRRYKRLNFGVTSAAEIFQNHIAELLTDISGSLNTSDDILIYGKSQEEHDQALKRVFDRLLEKNLTLNKGKCEFNKDQIEFYGFMFGKTGVSPDPKKVTAIQNMKTPTNVKEVRSFLGLTNYVSRFIADYANITKPLRDLTKSNVEWTWGPDQEAAFNRLKTELTGVKTMSYFNPNLETEVLVDASPFGIGAVLTQRDKHMSHIISYASRALTDVESRYSQTEREALAVVWACEHYHLYLFGHHFTVLSDHKPLEGIYNKPTSRTSSRIERWNLRLQAYDFTLKYRPGSDNPADYLSRHPTENANATTRHESKVADEYISFLLSHTVPKAMTLQEITEATKTDPTLKAVTRALKSGQWCTPHDFDIDITSFNIFKTVRDELSFSDEHNVLLRSSRIVIPRSLQSRAIDIAHEGHQGMVKTKQLVREKVWFPHIDRLVETKVQSCLACLSTTPDHPAEPLKMTTLPDRPWSEVSIDFCGPFPSGEYLLVAIDAYSRFPEVEILTSTSAKATVPKLDAIFARHGVPDIVKSDNGPPFNSHDFAQFADYLGFQHRKVTPLWPQANGGVERFMSTIKKTVQAAQVEKKAWKQELYRFLRNYRATPHSTTGVSPAEALFNRKMKIKLPEISKKTSPTKLDKKIRLQDEVNKKKMKEYADVKRRATEPDIQVGDPVLVRQRPENKLCPHYSPTPMKVTSRKGSMVTADGGGRKVTRNSSFFKKVPLQMPPHAEPPEVSPDAEPEDVEPTVPQFDTCPPESPEPPPDLPRRSSRVRRLPQYLQDYE